MNTKKLPKIVLGVGALLSILGAAWWYLFYSEALKHFEAGTMGDVFKCLYGFSEDCQIVNESVALLGDTTAYSPWVFLVGVALLVLGIVLSLAGGKN